MTKDRYERKTYRRSPGREYGYDYDPLRSQRNGSSQSGRLDASGPEERWSSRAESSSKPSLQLAQRPDPRRTRQLLRQSILAEKSRSTALQEVETEQQDEMVAPVHSTSRTSDQPGYKEQEDTTLFRNRYRTRNNRPVQEPAPEPEAYTGHADETLADEWNELDFVDPDLGYEDPLDRRLGYSSSTSLKSPALRSDRRAPAEYQRRREPEAYPEEYYEEDDYADEEEYAPARRKEKKRGLSRRKLLLGLGLVAAGGVAAYELGPKIPQAVQDVTANVEHQIQDAYNKGLAAGANAARKEILTGLNNLEGYSLDAAINVAKLTRLAYDAFVVPLITLAATVTGDFLNVTLQALKSARGFLFKFNQDNDTLAALQTVLETWVKQVNNVPKEWQTITDTDLDGAQGYLRALQNKIRTEQAQLDGQVTPTPAPKSTKSPNH